MTGFRINILYNGLLKILLYEVVDGYVRKLNGLKNFEDPTLRLSVLLSELSASTVVVFHLQLSSVPRRSIVVVDDEASATEKTRALENKIMYLSVYYKPRNRLSSSTIVIFCKKKKKKIGDTRAGSLL